MERLKRQKGITLIALIITIIVMLILVGVTVTVSLNGGLFSTAQKAAGDTEVERDKELALSDGTIEVDGKKYASYQDYLDNEPIVEAIVHNGVIPEGGTYYTGIEYGDGPSDIGYTTTYTAGDNFPATMSNLDAYEYGGYTYVYNATFDGGEPYNLPGPALMSPDTSINGWTVTVFNNRNQSSYGEIITTINGKNVTSMESTFYGCNTLTVAPKIPNTVTNMYQTFAQCSSLADVSSVIIPTAVTKMVSTFELCTALTTGPSIPSSVEDLSICFGRLHFSNG